MKTVINGIIVEGTPEEIFHLMGLSGDVGSLRNRREGAKPKSGTVDTDWVKDLPKITSGDPPKRCSSSCFCTGACEGKFKLWDGTTYTLG